MVKVPAEYLSFLCMILSSLNAGLSGKLSSEAMLSLSSPALSTIRYFSNFND